MKTQNWISLSAIQVGGAICLPVLLIGFELARQYGLLSALIAILIGNVLLFSLSLVYAKMSTASDKVTAAHAELYFGRRAKAIFACVMALSMCLWFAIQAQLMAQDVIHMLPESVAKSGYGEAVVSFFIAALIVICALSGIRSIEMLSQVAVPLMIITMCIALFRGTKSVEYMPVSHLSGLSLVLAVSIGAVVDMPTFFRHAANSKEAIKACVTTFLIGIPLVEMMGAFLSASTQAGSFMEALYCFDGSVWKGWILAFIMLAGWTTNNTNLYSASMSIQSLLPKLSDKKAILFLGAVAAVLSACNIIGHLSLFLDVMGITISSMGGVILSAFIMQGDKNRKGNMLAFVLGIGGGFYGLACGGFLTAIAIVDALIISSIVAVGVNMRKIAVCNS